MANFMTDELDNANKSGNGTFIALGDLIDLFWLHVFNVKCA